MVLDAGVEAHLVLPVEPSALLPTCLETPESRAVDGGGEGVSPLHLETRPAEKWGEFICRKLKLKAADLLHTGAR